VTAPAVMREALDLCRAALETPELLTVSAALRQAGVTDAETVAAAARARESSMMELVRIRDALQARGFHAAEGALERLVLMRTALHSLPAVPSLPVGPDVMALYLPAVQFMATPGAPDRGGFEFTIGHPHFAAMCKVVSLRRFPGGQFDWEASGVLRSWFLRIGRRHLPGLLRVVIRELGGLEPLVTPHYSVCRKHRLVLTEGEVFASYRRMAAAMERQPHVRGFVGHSWLLSDEVHRVSPHLAWMNRVFRENGGFLAPLGEADEGSGVFHGVGARRRELYEKGEFRPTLGLVIWPRARMIEWARRQS
jgi:hypothetical protein